MIQNLGVPERIVPSNGPNWKICVAHRLDEIMQVISLRAIAYMHEQSCPYDEEIDGNDFAGATHLIARLNGEPVGCVRLRWFAGFKIIVQPAATAGPILRVAIPAGKFQGVMRRDTPIG